MGLVADFDGYLDSVTDARAKVVLCSFMRSSWSMLSLLSCYLAMVFIGPQLMKGRRPFSLKRLLIVYNVVQVVANAWLTYKVFDGLIFHEEYSLWCWSVMYNRMDDFGWFIYNQLMLYFCLKVLDMCDTLFFILRKKNNQVTFLHVFHHISMVVIIWLAVIVYPGGTLSVATTLNAIVHVLMYTYYLLSALKLPLVAYVKPYLTKIQLVQFVLNTGHLTLSTAFGSCESPVIYQSCVVLLNIILFWLFMKFYNNSYLSNAKGRQKLQQKAK